MSPQQSIFLVGPMGSGKSAVGRRLASQLGWEFCDSDTIIESRTGVDIAFIFEKEGEAGFRRRERRVIDEITARKPIVLATGGGAILAPANRKCLGSRGTVVYLHASVEQQFKRTRHGKERPLLKNGDRRQVLDDLMQDRDPLYREIADVLVETDGRTVAAVTAEIRETLADSTGGHGE
ncbi:MAG: shikimate kinase AroK [Gammaproteobacteria bacterium]|nr:shikimate kinase AroK [Gammaproteobacteria bacterium]